MPDFSRPLTLAEVFRPPSPGELANTYNALLSNRLNVLKLKEAERKIAQQNALREALMKHYQPAQTERFVPTPQNALVESLTGKPFEIPAYGQGVALQGKPARMDWEGAKRELLAKGFVEPALEIDKRLQEQKQKEFDMQLKLRKSVLESVKPFLNRAIEEGNNEMLQDILGKLKRHPAFKGVPLPDNVQILPDKTVEITRLYEEGELIDPLTGKPLPKGKYRVKARQSDMQQLEDGRVQIRPIEVEPITDKESKSKGEGRLTLAQQRRNLEIDASRKALERIIETEGLSVEEIWERIKPTIPVSPNSPFTKPNPNFNPRLKRILEDALERKYGDDPEYEYFISTYGAGLPLPSNTSLGAMKGVKYFPTKYKPGRIPVRTGMQKSTGRRVIQYDDGSIEYADQP